MANNLDRNSERYRRSKAASELLKSDAWRLIIAPAIERARFSEEKINLDSMDNVLKAAGLQGCAKFATGLQTQVEHYAQEFAKMR